MINNTATVILSIHRTKYFDFKARNFEKIGHTFWDPEYLFGLFKKKKRIKRDHRINIIDIKSFVFVIR